MKNVQSIQLVLGTLVALACAGAYGQSNAGSTTAPAAVSAPAPLSVGEKKAENRALQKRVRRELARTKGLDVANINVLARDSVVLLQGSVTTQAQIRLATSVAQDVKGVASVRNALVIRGYGQ